MDVKVILRGGYMTAERLRKTASPMHDVSALSHSGVWDGPYKGSEKNRKTRNKTVPSEYGSKGEFGEEKGRLCELGEDAGEGSL